MWRQLLKNAIIVSINKLLITKNKYLFDWRKSLYKDDSLTLHTDLYQINMMQVYFNQGIHNKKAVFEVYFRQLPFKDGFAVFAGLEHIVLMLRRIERPPTTHTSIKPARLSWRLFVFLH